MKDSGSEIETRTHNLANELGSKTGGPLDTNAHTYTNDKAGNMLTDHRTIGQTFNGLDYTYDAWNHLVEIEYNPGTVTVGEYEYNGLGWRTIRRADLSTGAYNGLDEEREFYYSASWQLLEERIDSNAADGWGDVDRVGQQFCGIRYIDDAVANRLDRDGGGSFDDAWWYLTDAQFSVRAMINTEAVGTTTWPAVRERVAYTPYGRARHRYRGDLDGDGDVDQTDLDILSATTSPPPSGDGRRARGAIIGGSGSALCPLLGAGEDIDEVGQAGADIALGLG